MLRILHELNGVPFTLDKSLSGGGKAFRVCLVMIHRMHIDRLKFWALAMHFQASIPMFRAQDLLIKCMVAGWLEVSESLLIGCLFLSLPGSIRCLPQKFAGLVWSVVKPVLGRFNL